MIGSSLLFECEAFAAAIAPELRTLYVIHRPECRRHLRGLAVPSCMSHAYRAELEADRRWRGPGDVVVLARATDREETFAIVVHELGHLLPASQPRTGEPSAEVIAMQSKILTSDLQRLPPRSPDHPGWYPHHGLQFIRRTLHLHHRAITSGIEVFLSDVLAAGPGYDLSGLGTYRIALGDEPRRMLTKTFSQIALEQPPRAFARLFRRDVRRWSKRGNKT